MQRNIHCLALSWYQFDTSITQTDEYIKHFVMQGSTVQTLRGCHGNHTPTYSPNSFIIGYIRVQLSIPFQTCWYLRIKSIGMYGRPCWPKE